MLRNTTFEVWVQSGTRWEIHSRFNAREHDKALEEAKDLEHYNPALSVRVVREDYDPNTGLADERVIYASRRRKPVAKGPAATYAGRAYAGSSSFRSGGPAGRQKVTRTTALVMMSLWTVVSGSIATVLTYIAAVAAPSLFFLELGTQQARSDALFIMFLAVFAGAALLLNGRYLSKVQVEAPKPSVSGRAPAGQVPSAPAAKEEPLPEAPPPQEPAQPAEELAPEEAAAEPAQPPETPAEADEGKAEPREEEPLSPEGEQVKVRMMSFFAAVLDEAKMANLKLDSTYGRFGFNLYLGGAADALGGVNGLGRGEVAFFVQEMLRLLDVPQTQARGFAHGFESYLSNGHHLAMFEAGRRAMLPFIEGDTEAARQLLPAFREWLNPATGTEAAPSVIAVMFTDIVGSTGQTQAVGDLAAQYVIRTHNRIVRSALVSCGGREIKHTGDGIMASFPSAVGAVDAAIEIQRRVAAANVAERELPFPLHIRIGINAGEPVAEDNDLFGATVQLAARVCAACGADDIAITEVVYHLCAGKPLRLVPKGAELLKGFTEPVALFTVLWQETDEEKSPGAQGQGEQASPQPPARRRG